MRLGCLVGLTLATGLALAACGDSNTPEVAKEEAIKIAVAGPLTGKDAAFGAQLKNGAVQGVEDINAAGGILGKKLELSIEDDNADPKQGVSIANKMAGEGVKFVIGHFNSGVSIPSSDVYNENGMLMVSPASTNPTFTDRGLWNVFRVCGRDDQQGTVAGQYIAHNLADQKVAIVHDKTTYGKGLADETKKALNEAGIQEVLYEGINSGEKDFSALIAKMKEAGAQLVYFGGVHTEAGLIARQMRDQGLNATLMSGDGIATDEFASIAGPAAEGTLMTFAPDPRKREEAAGALKKFEEKGITPEAYTLYSYAVAQIFKQAAEAAKSTEPKKVADQMRSGQTFNTVIGDIAFNDKGDVNRLDYTMYTWKKVDGDRISYVEN
ncbi:Leu/Ile/Val-binding protein homolog 1 [Candidatus Filomicrobium marinum]|uniref:Leu/Ile/Val-binding protein homolog 1 n=2 Tax=Filomicrobium TaxID=119044 RepID=A0A0D6JIR2_9HYPH|nr:MULTISPECIES: branched-chain amino acid ABC transporter substrate-binding protein [Filomicrobium]MCV0369313.1 branched-chain amino acid ABC transporter substrate-binding protein [Filomicrobium sp.]CFX39747.1 Leu/Ile/Val-binding protein homolog 1 [Candidatus Filomicrobium marinum]CPR21370.1 Leu/Ile/Val-binding protein homolog 1 [Candidatus Filomicrobium marinum]SDP27633.1 general L-amino acid-binding protein [Filomicrobium insigne]